MPSQILPLSDDILDDVLIILAEDPLSNIVMIADCTQLREWCDIRVLTNDNRIDAVFSLYSDLDFLATAFWCRDVDSLQQVMADYSERLVDKEFIAICTKEQLDQFGEACVILKPIRERQMVADRTTQMQCECKSTPVRLSMKDAEQLKELYRLSDIPAWTPNAMNLGPFYGIMEDDGRIASVAGIHYVTPYGTEIGNIATHPEYRRKGYAAACVKAVVEDVLEISELAILHYFEENTPAQNLYEKMGFKYSEADPVYFVRATCRG
ncbi:MAG: GNAT family N-acetyltransferase [Candidatus Thorarchaeota archaeon]|jgi:ribosomal protein S18 acetylase RimI-like enzyme